MAYQPSLLILYSVLYYGPWRHATLVYPLLIPCLSLADKEFCSIHRLSPRYGTQCAKRTRLTLPPC